MSGNNRPQSAQGETLRIESSPWDEFKEQALEEARQFDEGDETGPTVLSFEDPSQIQRLLTPKRLELIRSVMEESPASIRQLADRLDRNVSEVFDDVHLLEKYGSIPTGRARAVETPSHSVRFH